MHPNLFPDPFDPKPTGEDGLRLSLLIAGIFILITGSILSWISTGLPAGSFARILSNITSGVSFGIGFYYFIKSIEK